MDLDTESARRGRSKDGAHHKASWQTALEHHEELCAERARTIGERFNSVDVRFNSVDQHFDSVDQRFDSVDQRFDSVDQRFNSVDARFNSLEKRLDNIERIQLFTFGAILAWPPLLIAVLKLLP